VARGHGRGRTFQRDLTDPEEIKREVSRHAHYLMEDVPAEGRPVIRVTVKVRFVPFFTRQHAVKLAEPTEDEAVIEEGAHRALAKFELDRPVRLLGIRGEFPSPQSYQLV